MNHIQDNGEPGFQDKVVEIIPALRGYSRSLTRNAADADDLVQETLLRAMRHVDTFHAGTNLRAWLFTIMRNRFYTHLRKSSREVLGESDCVSSLAMAVANQDIHMEVRDVQRAFVHLPEPFRATMAFVVLNEKSYDEAARHFRCDIGTIKSRVNRGRRMLRDVVGRR